MADTYTCACCGGTFRCGWSDEEALEELRDTWGDVPLEECSVVCDDCWRGMHGDELTAQARAAGEPLTQEDVDSFLTAKRELEIADQMAAIKDEELARIVRIAVEDFLRRYPGRGSA